MATYKSLKYNVGAEITGEIATASIADNAITTAKINADAVTAAKIPDNAINSEHYTDGSIDTDHVADDQITLAKMASGTDGNLITYDTSGNPAAVSTGSDGQVLTSAGAGAAALMEDAAGGASFTSASIPNLSAVSTGHGNTGTDAETYSTPSSAGVCIIGYYINKARAGGSNGAFNFNVSGGGISLIIQNGPYGTLASASSGGSNSADVGETGNIIGTFTASGTLSFNASCTANGNANENGLEIQQIKVTFIH